MRWIQELKYEYERQVLGLALEVSHYPVLDILKAENFTNIDKAQHAQIYLTIKSFKIGEPVNILTVSQKYKALYGDNLYSTSYIVELTNTIHHVDIHYVALVVLELDIRIKIYQYLQKQKTFFSKQQNTEAVEILNQSIQLLEDRKADTIESLHTISHYLKTYFPDEYEAYKVFVDALPKVSQRIKTLSQLKNAFAELEKICRSMVQQQNADVAAKAKDIYLQAISGSRLQSDLINQINKIHASL